MIARMNYYIDVLKKYAVFNGRARRAEYWFFALFNIIIAIGLGILDAVILEWLPMERLLASSDWCIT